MSVRFAPLRTTASGTPAPSVSRCRLTPHFPRSVGLAPVASASPGPPCILELWLTTPWARQIQAPLVSQGRKKASVAASPFLPEPEPLPGPLAEPVSHKDGRAGRAVRKEEAP